MKTETQKRETPNAERQIVLRSALCVLSSAFLLASGCKSPFDRTKDASGGGPTAHFSPTPAFVIFSSEVMSGGGAFEYPGGENQALSFNDRSNPISQRSIRYSWSGQPVSNAGCPAQNPTHDFAGFDLMNTPTIATYAATPGRNLSQAGYTKVTFFARGSLSTNTYLKVEVSGPGTSNACSVVITPCTVLFDPVQGDPRPGTSSQGQDSTCAPGVLNSTWGQYSIPIAASNLISVKDFFKATFVFVDPFAGNEAPGQGGTAYLDSIQYQP